MRKIRLREKGKIGNSSYPAIFLLVLLFSLNALGQGKLPASPIKTIYITPTSHYDLGFVEPPDQVRERAVRHIDEVIRMAEANSDFRWTIESVWQVEEWLKRQKKPTSVLPKDKANIARLMNLIKSGRVALSTSWGSMHTDFMGEEELNRLCYGYATLKRSYGIESELALQDDVPGHPSSVPAVYAGSGTKYLVVGANLFIAQATSLAPGRVPFYWESPDGSRVLTWVSQGKRGGYVEALTDFYLDPYTLDPYTDKTPFDMFNPEQAGKKKDIEVMEIGVTEFLNRYNAAGYKFDAAMAMYAHDFIEPSNELNLLRAVEMWNRKHDEVKLKVATPTEFFKYIEGKYSGQLETHRGDWSGLWSEAKTRSPRLSALARYAHDQTPVAETLWSALAMTRNVPAPVGNFSLLYDLMLGYDEHSGAGNNGWPQLNSVWPLEEQNRQYVRDMKAARDGVDSLLDKGLSFVAQPTRFDKVLVMPANTNTVLVYNGSPWNRADVVRLDPQAPNAHIESIRDAASDTSVKFEVDTDGTVVFIAKDVPANGYASYEVRTVAGKAAPTLVSSPGSAIRNSRFAIKLRTDGNIESIRDSIENREIVNNNGERPFNDLLRTEGSDASVVAYPVAPQITVQRGPVISRITVRRERSIFPLSTVTIYESLNRVEIHNELDPKYEGFNGGNSNWNDSYYFAFPFNVSKNGLQVLRGGQKWFDRLPEDYLLGARRDGVSTQHLFGMTDGKSTALLAHRQAFHWVYPSYVATKSLPKGAPKEFPAMFTGKFPLTEATIYSRAIRNASEADTHDRGVYYMETVEPGLVGNYIYDYALSSEGGFDPVAAWKLGKDFNMPLKAQYVQVKPVQARRSFFSVDQPNVEIVTVKPISDNVVRGEVSAAPLDPQTNRVFVIRLQEFAGRPANAKIELPIAVKSAAIISLTEDRIIERLTQVSPLTVSLKPYQTLTVRFETE